MSEAQQLYQLQNLDLETEELQRSVQAIEEQLGETEELLAARQALADVQDSLRQQQRSMQELEWDLDKITGKLKELEGKLYGGTVKNPKELGSFEREAQMFKVKKSQTEDKILELMEAVETSHVSVRAAKARFDEVQAAWERSQAALNDERARLLARLEELSQSRQALVKTLRPEVLDIYEDLRLNKRGRAVAKVEQNTCQGCRITLPTNEVQLARSSPRLVFCSSCGRILLATR
ncbi:MAG: zinc ribbon domain-containing protein [Chloroflexota bacterium]